MQCADFERRMNQLLDQRRAAEEDVGLQSHAAVCPECQQILIGQARLLEMVRYEIAPLPDDFAQRVLSLPARSSRFTLRGKVIAAVLALAATILIVAAPIANRLSGSRWSLHRGGNRQVAQKPLKHRGQAGVGTIASVQPGVRPAISPGKPVPSSPVAANESDELRRMIHDIWQKIPEVPPAQLEPIDRLAGGFRPLASTLGAAIDAIRRSLPVGRDQEPTKPQANFISWDSGTRLS